MSLLKLQTACNTLKHWLNTVIKIKLIEWQIPSVLHNVSHSTA